MVDHARPQDFHGQPHFSAMSNENLALRQENENLKAENRSLVMRLSVVEAVLEQNNDGFTARLNKLLADIDRLYQGDRNEKDD